MRIAVLVIALCLTMIVGLQSCALAVGGGMINDQSLAGCGAAGVVLAFLFVLGAAFAMGLPRVSLVMFALAALIGFSVGLSTAFKDMTVWGTISLVLAVMSYFGSRELARKKLQPSGKAV
jgi:ABC-type multidrug transport system permease subunit